MDSNRLFESFPQFRIRTVVIEIINHSYRVNWSPHIVRSQHSISQSKLRYIDYVIPCFDLAKLTHKNVQDVVRHIAEEIRENKLLLDYEVEALAGYVNIQLPIYALQEGRRAAERWLETPSLLIDKKNSPSEDYFLLMGPTIANDEEFGLADKSCAYVNQLYDLLNKKHSASYIVSDSSEDALPHLLNFGAETASENQIISQHFKLRRQIESYLRQPDLSEDNEVRALFAVIHAEWLPQREELLKRLGVVNYEIIFESDIAGRVHGYLDRLSDLHNSTVIRDAMSAAVYYTKNENIFALRSTSGLLYRFAYIIYSLTEISKLASQKQKIFVFANAHHHVPLKEFVGSYLDLYKESEIIYFDPSVSQRNIKGLGSDIESVKRHFNLLSSILKGLPVKVFDSAEQRKLVLELIDLPLAINYIVQNGQLPNLFDALDQSVRVYLALRG
jgi:hypothetical protein